ncbi:MAG: hypothetical protein HOM58_22505 [Rhodospirillaceae bacterium]|jgi:hypothetical protein|nr:hypothetical protein [Rhodospirillaceae bacterium]MBT5455167.1 hypothetical protein [Rhodospirillaceae bacterium]
MKNHDEDVVEERREFLKSAGKVAITAPAVALLLSANVKPASAVSLYPPVINGES